MQEPRTISLRWRISLWILAWVIAAMATVEGGIALLIYAWMFPSGLQALVTPKRSDIIVLILGWLLYIGLTVFGLLQKRRIRYFITLGILCVLLALNAVGCHVMINNIHFSD